MGFGLVWVLFHFKYPSLWVCLVLGPILHWWQCSKEALLTSARWTTEHFDLTVPQKGDALGKAGRRKESLICFWRRNNYKIYCELEETPGWGCNNTSTVGQEQKHLSKTGGNLYLLLLSKLGSEDWFPWITVNFSDGLLEISCLVELRGATVHRQES